ncbi:hypothetical protein L6452_44780 [Arctium lappa]|nr:hypothetical protein L6452_44780 [Arctium lappa]
MLPYLEEQEAVYTRFLGIERQVFENRWINTQCWQPFDPEIVVFILELKGKICSPNWRQTSDPEASDSPQGSVRKAHGGHLSVTTYTGSANVDGKISPVDVGENEVLGLWDYESFLIIVIVSESGGDGGMGRETRGRE